MGIPLKPNRVATDHDVFEEIDDSSAERIIAESEGVLAFDDGSLPSTALEVSLEVAARFFSFGEAPGGDIHITGFDLEEVVASRPLALTIPARIDGRPVTRIVDMRFDTPKSRAIERIKAKPLRAPLGLLTLPEGIEIVGRGVLAGLMPYVTRVPSTTHTIELAGLSGQAAYLNMPLSTDEDRMRPGAKPKRRNRDFEDPTKRFGLSRPMFGGSPSGFVTEHSEETVPAGLRFVVDPANPYLCSIDGSLYTRDLSELLFLAIPYQRTTYLPEGLRSIGSDAYIYGRGAPEEIIVPSTLRRAEFTPSSSTLWVIDDNPAFELFAHEQGWMTASSQYVKGEVFDYDPLPDGTVRIVRVRGPQTTVSVPADIDGRTVTQIGNNAFPRLARTIEIADTVTHILGNTTCPYLKSLTLPRSLRELGANAFVASELERPVVIPAGTKRIGGSCFERGILTFAAVGANILLDPPFTKFCFTEGLPPFDFARYDRDIIGFSGASLKLRAMLVRLATPYAMSDEVRAEFQAYAAQRLSEVLDSLARTGNLNTLRLLLEANVFDEQGCDRAIARFAAAGQTACTIELMEWRHRTFGHTETSGATRFAL